MRYYAFGRSLAFSLLLSVLVMPIAFGQSSACTVGYNTCKSNFSDLTCNGLTGSQKTACNKQLTTYNQLCTTALKNCSSMYVYPEFRVLSALYMPPGNESSVAYSTTSSYGASTSYTSSLSTSFSTGRGIKVAGISLGTTFTLTDTDTTTTSDQVITQSQGTETFNSNSNPIDHTLDRLTVWLNPQITVSNFPMPSAFGGGTEVFTATGNAQYVPATGASIPDAPSDATSLVTVSIAELLNPTTLPVGALVSQTLDGTAVPNLLKLCANRIPESQCSTQQQVKDTNGCGCQASDFTAIVQTDPFFDPAVLAKYSNPNVTDVNSVDPDNARFVQVVDANKQSVLLTLSGSQSIQSETITDTHNTSFAYTHTVDRKVGVSYGYSSNAPSDSPDAFSWNASYGANIEWSSSKTVGSSTSNAHSQTVTLGTSTSSCYENVAVYEDTVFHTYAFQSTSNASNPCP